MKRALYRHLTSAGGAKTVCHARLSTSEPATGGRSKQPLRSDSRRLTPTSALPDPIKLFVNVDVANAIVARRYAFMSIYIHSLDFPTATANFYCKVKFFFPVSNVILLFFTCFYHSDVTTYLD